MANDLSKKITIEVELESEKLTRNITNINNAIDALLAKQQQLNTSGQQNTTTFNAIAAQLESFQKNLKDLNTQITSNTTALNTLNSASKNLDSTLSATAGQHQKNAKAAGDSTEKVKGLSTQVSALGQSLTQQAESSVNSSNQLISLSASISKATTGTDQLQTTLSVTAKALTDSGQSTDESKSKFDAHKKTMDHLKKSFDEVKDVSGLFGPSLQDAAKGFGLMKSGLAVVKDGLTGVGTALKADGFDFLLQILQAIFDYFIKTSNGTKKLQGAISAIGVVVNKVTKVFHSFMDGIINAFSHPIDTLKSLGKMIEQNLINRFKAFGVILDGIIHLDFKKISNGAIEAVTGVADATDKVVSLYNNVVKGVKDTTNEMADAYNKAGKAADNFNKKVGSRHNGQQSKPPPPQAPQVATTQRGGLIDDPMHAGVEVTDSSTTNQPVTDSLVRTQVTEDKKTEIKKTALQKFEDYAKQSGVKLANEALSTLSNSIKQQSDAKVAALEKDKTNELNNKNLTAAQKMAIEQKYKQQESAIKAKAFKEQQELSIAQAIINGAEAVTKVSAQTGVLAALPIGVIVAETAAQVAKIASQKPPAYAKGGLHYTSDGRGGILSGYSRTDNTNAYLRSGEGVVVSEAMRVPWARNLVSAINVGFGGRDFSMTNSGKGYAVGGIFTDGGDANRYYNQPVNDQKNLANTIAYQMVNNFPPVYVDVKDINNQQNILAQTINRVNL